MVSLLVLGGCMFVCGFLLLLFWLFKNLCSKYCYKNSYVTIQHTISVNTYLDPRTPQDSYHGQTTYGRIDVGNMAVR